MTVADYARQHGLPWSTAKRRMSGGAAWQAWVSAGCPRNNPRALPDETLARIRELLAAGHKHEWIALECGVGRSTVTQIRNGRRRSRH